MSKTTSDLPGIQSLTEGISFVLTEGGFTRGRVTILNRESNVYKSTSPCEIVTCRLADGQILKLLCKYSAGQDHSSYGHRGGLAYEGEVYRRILMTSQLSIPVFYGTYTDKTDGRTWLVIEYLQDSCRINRSLEPDAIFLAVRWIGELHSAYEVNELNDQTSFLKVYDKEYYLGWLDRASWYAKHLQKRFPWLESLHSIFEECVVSLPDFQQSVIHGEYYPMNVLIRNRSIYPVDWESAAIGPGEIDLAALIEGWPEDILRECESVYKSVRWPNGAPCDFAQRLDTARVYLGLRWLGDNQEWTADESSLWCFEMLYVVGKRWGMIRE